MKFCVCIKQVPDVSAPSRIEEGRLVQDTDRLVMNAYDASAVEECLVMRNGTDSEVTVVSIGGDSAKESIRKALAMGADSGVLIRVDDQLPMDSRAYAEILAAYFRSNPTDVLACGKQAQDTDAGLTGGMLAALLELPYASNAIGLEVDAGSKTMKVTRQSDSGQEILDVTIPCLVTCSNDMNEPRIPTLKGIMQSKRKPVTEVTLEELGLAERYGNGFRPDTELVAYLPPQERPPARIIEGEPEETVSALGSLLDQQTSVI